MKRIIKKMKLKEKVKSRIGVNCCQAPGPVPGPGQGPGQGTVSSPWSRFRSELRNSKSSL